MTLSKIDDKIKQYGFYLVYSDKYCFRFDRGTEKIFIGKTYGSVHCQTKFKINEPFCLGDNVEYPAELIELLIKRAKKLKLL